MLHEFIETSIRSLQTFAQDSILLYFSLSLIYYLVGGLDETLITLIILHIIYVISCLICKAKLNISNLIYVYLIIIIGNILDSILKLNNTSLRAYLILYYTYNVLVDTLNMIGKDNKVPIPKKLKKILLKLKKE